MSCKVPEMRRFRKTRKTLGKLLDRKDPGVKFGLVQPASVEISYNLGQFDNCHDHAAKKNPKFLLNASNKGFNGLN